MSKKIVLNVTYWRASCLLAGSRCDNVADVFAEDYNPDAQDGAVEFPSRVMVKKNTNPEPVERRVSEDWINPAELRTRIVPIKDLLELTQECREWLARIEVTLRHAEQSSLTEFRLDGVTQFERARKLLSRVAPNVYKGVVEATIRAVPRPAKPDSA